MKRLREYCFYIPPVVLFFSIICSFAIFFPITSFEEYFPEWLRSKMGGWTFISIFITNTVLSFLSFTVMLNVFYFVRSNIVLSFLTFFWAVICQYVLIFSNPNHPDFGFNLMIPIAFIIPQTYYFILLQRKLRRGDFDINSSE